MSVLKSFLAKFDGWCPICHKRIEEGDECTYEDGKVVHASCVEDDE